MLSLRRKGAGWGVRPLCLNGNFVGSEALERAFGREKIAQKTGLASICGYAEKTWKEVTRKEATPLLSVSSFLVTSFHERSWKEERKQSFHFSPYFPVFPTHERPLNRLF
jgi:hypothetical protein